MIFIGDVACPTKILSTHLERIFSDHSEIFGNATIVGNLEGLVSDEESLLTENTPVLFNHFETIKVLKQAGLEALGLANNHTLDLPQCYNQTQNVLKQFDIAFSGAGLSKEDALRPAVFIDKGEKIAVFYLCWDFLLYTQKNPSNGVHIAEISELETLTRIQDYKTANPDDKIIVFPHWSLDLETLPFPMYRQWSKKLIDIGVNCVIGCHSHCVQGGEQYKNGYIIYGLGNFFLPNGVFVNGTLHLPELARIQLVFEWNSRTNQANCHWFQYENDDQKHFLTLMESSGMSSVKMKKYSPYQNKSNESYKTYFKKNRRKKFLIPLYNDYNAKRLNYIKTIWMTIRGLAARQLSKMNLRPWQN